MSRYTMDTKRSGPATKIGQPFGIDSEAPHKLAL